MWDYNIIQIFYKEALPLDRENTIHTGAAQEVATQRAKAKVSDKQNSSIWQSVLDPFQVSGRGGRSGRGRGASRNIPGPSRLEN